MADENVHNSGKAPLPQSDTGPSKTAPTESSQAGSPPPNLPIATTPPTQPAQSSEQKPTQISPPKAEMPLDLKTHVPEPNIQTAAPHTPTRHASLERGPTPPLATELMDDTARQPHTSQGTGDKKKSIVRTYQSDVSEAVRRQNESLATIALKENARRTSIGEVATAEPRHTKTVILIITSLVLIGLAVGMIIGIIRYITTAREPISSIEKIEAFIPSDSTTTFDVGTLSGDTLTGALSGMLESLPYQENALHAIIPTFSVSTAEGEREEPLRGREFLERLETNADNALVRSVEDDFLVGALHTFGAHTVLVFKISFFENAFAGMLRWEPRLAEDLPFVSTHAPTPSEQEPVEVSTTTAVILTPQAVPPRFVDAVIANHDARVLNHPDGSLRLLYAFPDTRTLVITGSDFAFAQMLERLDRVEFSR